MPELIKGGSETILLAEDDVQIRTLISSILIDYGYKVIDACDGEEAIAKFIKNKNKISLIIVDGIMPKKNGKEVFKEIQIVKPDVKIIFVSGYSEDLINFQELSGKGVVYMQKPVLPSVLLAKIREVLDR